MKHIKNLFQSLRTKLIAVLIAISVIPIVLSGINSYVVAKRVLNDKLEVTSTQTIHEVTRGIDNYLNAMSNIVYILSKDTNLIEANNPTYFEFAKGLMANTRASDDKIINIFAGTETGMFYTDPVANLPAGFDHRKRDWYIQAVNNPNKVIITDPYIDTASKEMVITIASSIQKDSNLVGVVGIDIELTKYSESLSNISIGKEGYLFVTDQNGVILAHPNQGYIGQNMADFFTIWDDVKNNADGFLDYESQGTKGFVVYNTSDVTSWKVIAAMNNSELSNDTRDIRNVIAYLIIFTIIAASLCAIFFTKPISKNINLLIKAFYELSKGNLRTSVSIHSKDEFQVLGEHFNEMVVNMSNLIHNVNEASTTVLDTSIVLANMSEETNASLSEVARAVEEVAKGTMEQAQNAADGATSVTDLADKLNLINSSTNMMDSLSKNANELTMQGLSRMENLMTKSDHTKQSTSKVSELVYETSESMEQISAISTTIEKITAQTNLLALNASIEAARAGESGKGFAVVANEIRNLADQSKSSTVKIKKIIEEIAEKTALSVEAMEITQKNVEEQVSLVNQTQSLFQNIMEAVNVLSNKVTEIKQSTEEISNQKNNIVFQIENISAISEEAASATEEVTSSTEQISATMDEITKQAVELQRLSEELKNKINTFQYK